MLSSFMSLLACAAAVFSASPSLATGESPPNLSEYGYPYSWTSDDGWWLTRPIDYSSFEEYPGSTFQNIFSAEECARICSTQEGVESPGGAWNSEYNECFCEEQLDCMEPCLGEEETPGITFSSRPRSDFGYCERTICEYFPEDLSEWCEEVGFDAKSCTEKKLSNYGYPHSWTSEDGWFLTRPTSYTSIDEYPGSAYDDVATVDECARICSTEAGVDNPGGAWNSEDKTCFCEEQLDCIEPCLGEEETPGVTFSARPRADFGYCERSICDYFSAEGTEGYGEWCEEIGFDQTSCTVKKLSNHGFPHSWTADEGWFVLPDSVSFDDYPGTSFENVSSVDECAQLCSALDVDHPGGSWGSDNKICFCEQQLQCLEPCLGEEEAPGIIFSTQPRTGFGYCEKSYCQYYAEEDGEWCKEVGFDVDKCKHLNASQTSQKQGPDVGGLGAFDPTSKKESSAAATGQGPSVVFGVFISILLFWGL